MNREEWLTIAIFSLRGFFKDSGYELPEKIVVSVGFPSSRAVSTKQRKIGECWYPTSSKDGTISIFISPVIESGLEALGVLVHELGHANLGHEVGHRKPFAKFMEKIGLEGKPKATHPSAVLNERLNTLLNEIGPFPHSQLTIDGKERKVQTTRMLKVECGKCGYTARVARKWLDIGYPLCPTDSIPMDKLE